MRNFLLFSFWVVFTPCAFTATDDGIDPSLFNEIDIDIDPSLFNEISNTNFPNGVNFSDLDALLANQELDALLANQERREIPEISIAQQSLVKTNDGYLSKRRKFSENSSEKKHPESVTTLTYHQLPPLSEKKPIKKQRENIGLRKKKKQRLRKKD